MKKVGYRLHSVFIHRGQATFGHYWIYIRDFKNKLYRMYNDQTITEVPESEVFNDNEDNAATPYFLVFIREDLTDQMVASVVRDVMEEEDEDLISSASTMPPSSGNSSGQTKTDSSLSQASTIVASSDLGSEPLPVYSNFVAPSTGEAEIVASTSQDPAPAEKMSYAQIAAVAGAAFTKDISSPKNSAPSPKTD